MASGQAQVPGASPGARHPRHPHGAGALSVQGAVVLTGDVCVPVGAPDHARSKRAQWHQGRHKCPERRPAFFKKEVGGLHPSEHPHATAGKAAD